MEIALRRTLLVGLKGCYLIESWLQSVFTIVACIYANLVLTKSVNSKFRAFLLAPVTRIILIY